MEAHRGHQHRAAVAIVAEIVDVLQDERSEEATPEVDRVISLDDEFPPVIQPAVAQQEAAPAKRKVAAAGAPKGILKPRPARADLVLPASPSARPPTHPGTAVQPPQVQRFLAGPV